MTSSRRFLISIVVALLPLIMLTSFIAITQQSTLFAKHPSLSDEIIHWAQPAAFRDAGFNSGYFTANEKTARISLFRFYAWGPAPPVFYGVIAHFIEWKFYTPLLVNLVLFGIAIVAFINIQQLNWRQIVWIALLVMTYPPLMLYAAIIMLEVLSHAVAVGLVLLFAWLIAQKHITERHLIVAVIAICLVATIRATWSVLLIPLFILHFVEKPTWRRAVLDFSAVIVLVGAMFLLYLNWSSSYPNVRNMAFERMSVDLVESTLRMIGNLQRNIRLAFEGNVAHLVMRLQLIIIVVGAVFMATRGTRRSTIQQPEHRLAIVLVCGLLGIFMFEVIGHEMADWRDYRVFAPYVLFAMLLLIVSNRQRFVGLMIALSLISYVDIWPTYLNVLKDFNPANSYTSRMETHEALFHELNVRFDSTAESPWCNTVFYTVHYFLDPGVLVAFDDAMGLTLLNQTSLLPEKIRSHYLLFDDPTVAYLGDRVQLRLLVELPVGNLYENLDSACNSVEAF